MAQSETKANIQRPDRSRADRIVQLIGGSKDADFNYALLRQVLGSLPLPESIGSEERDERMRSVTAAMIGIGPSDEIEGMIAAQLVATHNAAMECFRRAMPAHQNFDVWRESLNQANKLVRSHGALVETLNRYRGKGQQQVTVKDVHVNDGGQAIVGTINQARGAPKPDAE